MQVSEIDLAHAILNAQDDALFLLDESGSISAMNHAAEELTGYREVEMVGRCLLGGEVDVITFAVDANATTVQREGLHVRVQRKDGAEFEAEYIVRTLAINGNTGSIVKLRARPDALTSEAGLEDTIKKLSAIFDGMADGLVLIDEVGTMYFFSAGAQRLFGYPPSEALGCNVKILMPSPFFEAHDGYLRAYRQTGEKKIIGIGREVTGRKKDGSLFPMYLSVGEIWLSGKRYFVGMTHDLSRLKRAEEQLLTASAAMEQSPVGFMISNLTGEIQYVNSALTRLTGYAAEELLGAHPRLLRSSNTPIEQYRRLWDTIKQGREWRGEILNRRKDGTRYWALEMITPLRDKSGRVTHYLAIQQDITEQKRDKEALAESEERFRTVAEMAGEWLWEQDAEGRYTYSSDAVRNILGIEPKDILGREFSSLFAEDCMRTELPPRREGSREFHRIVNCYRGRDGRLVFTESSGAPIFDNEGRLRKWRGIDRDITAEKEYENRLRVRDRALESLHVGIAISDARVTGHPNIYVNPALSRITGYSREELLGHSMHMLQGPDTDPDMIREMTQALARGEGFEVTLKNYRKNGEAFWNELIISPVRDGDSVVTHYVGIQTDVTERRRAEESRRELEIAKRIQLSLLPDAPLHDSNAIVFGVCEPATHVGGDYFDYFENAGALDMAIADVSGHSVGAALMMTMIRSMLRAEARKAVSSQSYPAAVLQDLNDLLYRDLIQAELFVTMFYCRFEPEVGLLRYANAGHNPGLLLRSSEANCRELDADGIVLGVKPAMDFEDGNVVLGQGDMLLLYTDGVTEAEDAAGRFYGLERLREAFERNRRLSPQLLVNELLQDLQRFRDRIPARDDVAMVVMQVR